jgi:hypothetical protein
MPANTYAGNTTQRAAAQQGHEDAAASIGSRGEGLDIANRIRTIRLEHSRSVKSVEAEAGFAQGLVARLEGGEQVPSLENLEKLAEVLRVPVHEFFFGDSRPISTRLETPSLTPEGVGRDASYTRSRTRPN